MRRARAVPRAVQEEEKERRPPFETWNEESDQNRPARRNHRQQRPADLQLQTQSFPPLRDMCRDPAIEASNVRSSPSPWLPARVYLSWWHQRMLRAKAYSPT